MKETRFLARNTKGRIWITSQLKPMLPVLILLVCRINIALKIKLVKMKQLLDIVIVSVFEMSESLLTVPGVRPTSDSSFLLSVIPEPQRELKSLPATGRLRQPWLLWSVGKWTGRWTISVYLCLFVSFPFQYDKNQL